MPFRDRREAGRRLAERLSGLRATSPLILGLPRGGVPVAYEVAKALGSPLDILVVRKLGVPFQPELGMGAVGEGGVRVLNADVLRQARVTESQLAQVEARERAEVEERAARLRGGRPALVTGVGALGSDSRDDGDEVGRQLLGPRDVARRAHDAAAACFDRKLDALREDVGRRAVITRQHGDAERDRLREPRLVSTVEEAIHAGAKVAHAPACVQRQVTHAERAGDAGRPFDGGGDVVELEVEEDLVAEPLQSTERLGSGRDEQLQADFGDPEPGPHIAGDPQGGDEVVDVERDGQTVAQVGLAIGVSHGLLLGGLGRGSPRGAGTSVRAPPPLATAPGARRT